MPAVTVGPGHILLAIRLTPRSSVDRIDGLMAQADGSEFLAARVRAVPEDGAANDALVRLLSDALAVPRRSIAIARGHQSRLKMVRVEGDPAELSERVRKLLG
ncbi:MAG: DUF167 family protein [Bauldia sp.]